ncbi:hypothetical protein RJ639_006919 [Escallonia herrerae]|uniref:Transmembrane protein 214-A n=1 Tax=Escallonia herrerae TaxID=1293975 RepID=A0AA88VYU8_9ASTE|nr:hypothetical protein RJ639_006919 [Escallonia herrerae]
MEDKNILSESNHIEDGDASTNPNATNNNHGWQKVTYAKRQRKQPATKPAVAAGSVGTGTGKVFQSLEKQSEERRRRIEAQRAANADLYDDDDVPIRSKKQQRSQDHDDDENDSDADVAGGAVQNGAAEEKRAKVKKPKKPKVTVVEAAGKIDAADLANFLAEISIPVSHIPEAVYKTSVDWINQRSHEALVSFVLWSLDSILSDFASQHSGAKGSKKGAPQISSKSQVAMFAVLAMVLRRKPDVLITLLPTLKDNAKYQGQDKLPVIVWMIVQACQGDLAVGLYSWAHHLLPIIGGKSNPQSRDLALQLVERILSAPKARTILVNGAVRKGERLIPPLALDLLLRVTFPASSARVKATERFEAIYPTLKEVALAGSPGSKAMKQVSQQVLNFAVKAAGEDIPELSQEATTIFIWCLTQHPDCYKQWDKVYMENIEASVAVLRKLTEEWKTLSAKQSSLEALGVTLRSFKLKNEKALEDGEEAARQAIFKDSNKYCKVLLGRLSRGHGCMKSLALGIIVLGVGAVVASPGAGSWDWSKYSVLFSDPESFFKQYLVKKVEYAYEKGEYDYPFPSISSRSRCWVVLVGTSPIPIIGGKSNPQSRDLALQLVERILSAPKARTILVNGAVRKGERLLPPLALDLLLRVTFPGSSARVKDKVYMENIEASVAVLRKLTEEWKTLSAKQSSLEALGVTLRSFKLKNEKALEDGEKAARQAIFKDSNKYCKVLLGRLSRGHGCMKSLALGIIVLGVGAVVASPGAGSWDWSKYSVLFSDPESFCKQFV